MANSYRRVYLQIVFAVKYRAGLLDKSWRGELFAYIAGIINKRDHYAIVVNGVEDHIHIFIDYNCKELVEDLVREIKKASNSYINQRNLTSRNFQWQSGYGVFSYSFREKEKITNYIKKQEEHHSKTSFKDEYLKALKEFEIDFKNEYVFDFLE